MKNKQMRAMFPIPVRTAKTIADAYGYDQVIVIARRCGEGDEPHGEHVTTYGRNKEHCGIAARCGDYIKYKIMDWPQLESPRLHELKKALVRAVELKGHHYQCSALRGMESDCHCGWTEVKALAKSLEGKK